MTTNDQGKAAARLALMAEVTGRTANRGSGAGKPNDLTSGHQQFKSTPLQARLKDWLLSADFNVMVTLTFKPLFGVNLRTAEKTFSRFSSKVYSEFNRLHPSEPILMAPIVENSQEQLSRFGLSSHGREGTHIHAFMKLPGDVVEHEKRLQKLWTKTSWKLCGNPSIYSDKANGWFVPLTTPELQATYIGYAAKFMQTDCLGLLVNFTNIGPRPVKAA